ncbi:MAG: CotH kinase family protein [Bacteroidota bacterium]
MKKIGNILLITLLIFSACDEDAINTPSDRLTKIPLVEIQIPQEEYIELLSNKIVDFETSCRLSYNGEIYEALISASGAGSRYLDKWAFRIELQNGKLIEGLNEFNLSAQVYDPTGLYTTVASHLYRQLGFPTFFSKHVFVKINGKDYGLYPMLERVDENFFAKRGTRVTELFKLSFDAKFSFEETNYPQFSFEKKIPDDNNFNTLMKFIYARDTSKSSGLENSLSKFLDIENYLGYHILTSLMFNSDGFTNNFFLVKESPASPFKVIPWDFDKCFTRPSTAPLAGYNQIITKLFTNQNLLQRYKDVAFLLTETIYTEQNIFPVIDSTAALIKDAYNLDPYLGKGRYIFDDEILKLKNYIVERRKYFRDNINSYQGL